MSKQLTFSAAVSVLASVAFALTAGLPGGSETETGAATAIATPFSPSVVSSALPGLPSLR